MSHSGNRQCYTVLTLKEWSAQQAQQLAGLGRSQPHESWPMHAVHTALAPNASRNAEPYHSVAQGGTGRGGGESAKATMKAAYWYRMQALPELF